MARNPAWTREELILALDLYFRVGRKHEGPNHSEVIDLSAKLNRLPRASSSSESETFRNPSGVAMKLGNFLSHDPQYKGKGLARGNRLESVVWQEFSENPSHLGRVANAILRGIPEALSTNTTNDSEEFPEGAVLTRLHQARERNPQASRAKKKQVLERTGKLECEVCGFDFEEVYGMLGRGFAECHHVVPLADLPESARTKLSDLAVLCANCHRMIHRTRPVVAVAEFRTRLKHIRATVDS